MKESYYITKYLKPLLLGMGFQKIHKSSERFHSGWPDLEAIKDGVTVYIEVKVDDGKLTPLQIHELQELATAGALVFVITGKKAFKVYHTIQQITIDKINQDKIVTEITMSDFIKILKERLRDRLW